MAPGKNQRSSGRLRVTKDPPARDEGGGAGGPRRISKDDRRRQKKLAFAAGIVKASAKAKKRRRPSKKLVATLESLADALPSAPPPREAPVGPAGEGVRMRHRSLKSGPGAMKKRARVEEMERERFGKNMAQMAGGGRGQASHGREGASDAAGDGAAACGGSAARWAALRTFIQTTMDRVPDAGAG